MINNYDEFYDSLGRVAKELEGKWKKINEEKKKTNLIAILISVLIDICIFLIFNIVSVIFLPFVLFINLIFIFIVNLAFNSKDVNELNKEYKEKIISKMLSNFITDVKYMPDYSLPKSLYLESNYPGYFNRYYADDYVLGKIDGRKIIMADLLVEDEETKRDKDGNTYTETDTVFSGIYSKISLDKSINSHLTVMRKVPFSFSKDGFEFDSSEFNKVFSSFSNNKIVAFQIFTTDIMQDMIDLYKKYKIYFYMYINNDNLYILFNTGNLFEVFSKKHPKEVMRQYFEILKFIYAMVTKISKTIEETQV